jgi:putative hemolysin
VQQAGILIERGPAGGCGVCVFDDNRQCEEWALLRDAGPRGGLRVSGYLTAAARYCAITAGHYLLTAHGGAPEEAGRCPLPGGRSSAADTYVAAQCGAAATQPWDP